MLIGKVVMIGNTMGVVVPAAYRRVLNWRRGDHVAVQVMTDEEGQPLALKVWSVEHASPEPQIRIGQTALTKTRR